VHFKIENIEKTEFLFVNCYQGTYLIKRLGEVTRLIVVSHTVHFGGREIIAQTLIVEVIITANQILLGALRSFPEFSSDYLSDRMMENQRFYHGWMHPVVFGSNKQTLATDFYESSMSESLLWSRDCSIAIDCQSRLTLTHLSKGNFKSSPFR